MTERKIGRIIVACLLLVTVAVFFACSEDLAPTKCQLILGDGFSAEGTEYTYKQSFPVNAEQVPLNDYVTVSDGAAWVAYGSETYSVSSILVDKVLPLVPGNNSVYLVVTAADGVTKGYYKISFYKRSVTTAEFISEEGVSLVTLDNVNEGETFSPAAPTENAPVSYGGQWYKDEARTVLWNFATDKITLSLKLYGKNTSTPDLAYEPYGNGVRLTGAGTFTGDYVAPPDEVDGKQVVAISALPQGLKTLVIPKYVTEITASFDDYEDLTAIYVDAENTVYSANNCVLYNKAQTKVLYYPARQLTFDAATATLSWAALTGAESYTVYVTDSANSVQTVAVTSNYAVLTDYYGILSLGVANGNGAKKDCFASLSARRIKPFETVAVSYTRTLSETVEFTFGAVTGATAYSFRIAAIDYTYDVSASQVSGEGAFTVPFTGKLYGAYVLEYKLFGDDDRYEDSDWLRFEFDYVEPEKAVMPQKSVRFDLADLTKLSFPVTFNDARGAAVSSTELVIAAEDYSVDYEVGQISFTARAVASYPVGEYAVTLTTLLGDIAFTLTVTDTRLPYLTLTEFTMMQGGTDVEIPIVFNTAQLRQVSLSGASETVNSEYYSLNVDTSVLTVRAAAFAALAVGDYTLKIITTQAELALAVHVIEAQSGPFINTNTFYFDRANAASAVIELRAEQLNVAADLYSTSATIFSTDGALTRQADYTSHNDGETQYLKFTAEYLASLQPGAHAFALSCYSTSLSFTVHCYDSTLAPENLRLDVINQIPTLSWDYRYADYGYKLLITSGTGTVTVNCEGGSLPLSDYDLSGTVSVRVASLCNNIYSDSFTLKLPEIADRYYNEYTFLGETHNYIITSAEEYINLIEYAYYNALTSVPFYYFCSAPYIATEEYCRSAAQAEVNYLKTGITMSVNRSYAPEYTLRLTKVSYYSSVKEPSKNTGQTTALVENNPWQGGCDFTPTRAADYEFAIDRVTKTQQASTSNQLVFLAEKGIRPVCVAGSTAERMYNKAREILLSICDDDMNEFEKVHAIFEWIVLNTAYDKQMLADFSSLSEREKLQYNCFYMEGVFDDGVAVCDGYSKAFDLMCAIEGIRTYRVLGTDYSTNHAWNRVLVEGNWYSLDITWANRSFSKDDKFTEYCFHSYFLRTDAYFYYKHKEFIAYETKYAPNSTATDTRLNAYNDLSVTEYDVYSESHTDRLYRVASYDEATTLINTKLAQQGYLELEMDYDGYDYTTVSAALNDGQGITVDGADYTVLFNNMVPEKTTALIIYTAE